jgi:5-bromo-4-chloroindolyl phosphate hydrolysis protein
LDGGVSSERAARNQSLYRSINEKILELNQTLAEAGIEDSEWICECADTDCMVRVVATLREYEMVRSNPRTFIVSRGHLYPEVERVLNQNDRYMIVEKIDDAGQIAETLNPRPTPG